MERLRKLREPAAFALLAAVAAQLVLAFVTLSIYAVQNGPSIGSWIAAQQLSRDLVLAAALAVVGCALWGRPSAHARMLTLLGTVTFGVQTALGVVLTLIGMLEPSSIASSITLLLEQLIPAAAAVLSYRLHQAVAGQPAGQPSDVADQFPVPNRPPVQPPRSQSDQFGNPYSNSAPPNRDYRSSQQPPVRPPAGPADTWQPVAHNGPQRLEPSPYTSPVGPHNRSEEEGSEHRDQRGGSTDPRSGTDSHGGPRV